MNQIETIMNNNQYIFLFIKVWNAFLKELLKQDRVQEKKNYVRYFR